MLLGGNSLIDYSDALWAAWGQDMGMASLGCVMAPLLFSLRREQGERWGDYNHMKPRSYSDLGWKALSSFSSLFSKIPSRSKMWKGILVTETPVKCQVVFQSLIFITCMWNSGILGRDEETVGHRHQITTLNNTAGEWGLELTCAWLQSFHFSIVFSGL